MHRHDHYFKTFQGSRIRIEVLQCYGGCGKSQSCQFDFLAPGSKNDSETLSELASVKLSEEKSYDQVGWEMSEDESEGHRHLVFAVIERLCAMVEWITSFIEKERLKPAQSLWKREIGPHEPSRDAPRARTEGKRKKLNQLKEALGRYMRDSGKTMKEVILELHRVAMQQVEPFSLLTRAEAPRLLVPKSTGYELF
ncbi:MAG: hypothetical protein MN733_39735 [Nitrososphaera sp.]|nr:hypothetical protein [Nitrososphaera sp.]